MTVTLTYDATLARVRVDAAALGVVNTNPYFETNAAGWTGFGGSFARSTAQAHQGAASGLLTPDGVSLVARTESSTVAGVVAGVSWRVAAWVRCPVARTVSPQINWFDAAGVYLATAAGAPVALAANTWTLISHTAAAPASAGRASINLVMDGTPPASNLLFVDEAVLGTAAAATAAYLRVDRSVDAVRWTTVRGGDRLQLPTAAVDDYEFAPGVANTYRVRGYNAVDVLVVTETAASTPVIDRVWLKSVARPFLNTAVVVVDYGEISRKSRAGVFDVSGRTLPVVVASVRGPRQWQLQVRTDTPAAARALNFLLAGGDILFVQVPPGYDIPGGYVSVGDATQARVSRTLADVRRLFTLPMLEVAAPGPDVVGYAATWAGLLADFGTWTAVAAAFPTWAAVMEYVADPETVIVP